MRSKSKKSQLIYAVQLMLVSCLQLVTIVSFSFHEHASFENHTIELHHMHTYDDHDHGVELTFVAPFEIHTHKCLLCELGVRHQAITTQHNTDTSLLAARSLVTTFKARVFLQQSIFLKAPKQSPPLFFA